MSKQAERNALRAALVRNTSPYFLVSSRAFFLNLCDLVLLLLEFWLFWGILALLDRRVWVPSMVLVHIQPGTRVQLGERAAPFISAY